MKLRNGMEIGIYKGHYNKAEKVEGTENIYAVNSEITYPLYELEIYKNYRDISTKEECIEELIKDLKSTIKELKNLEKER